MQNPAGNGQLSIGNLIFGTGIDGTGSTLSSGNVGIGDATPISLLTVGAGDAFQVNELGQVVAGTWQGSRIGAVYGGTGIDTSASTGVPTISGGTWTVASNLGVTMGGTGTSTQFTPGSIVFAAASGVYSQNNARFFWDNANNRLGIGTSVPQASLQVNGKVYQSLGTGATFFGYQAGENDDLIGMGENSFFGNQAGQDNITGVWNAGFGYRALGNTTNSRNAAFGYAAINNNIDGYNNAAFGYAAMANGQHGSWNAAFGSGALVHGDNPNFNAAFGAEALSITSGSYSVAVGFRALSSSRADANTAVGSESLRNLMPNNGQIISFSDAGSGNVTVNDPSNGLANGDAVVIMESEGYDGTYVVSGVTASTFNIVHAWTGDTGLALWIRDGQGKNNTAIGYQSGYGVVSQATGSNNLFIGYQVGDNITSGNNNITIGYDLNVQNPAGNGQLSIGNLIFGTGIDGTGSTLSSGNVGIGIAAPTQKLTVFNGTTTGTYTTAGWVHASDSRLKTNVASIKNALATVNSLNGVSFNWIENPDGDDQIGFIAQDVQKYLPEVVVGTEENGYGVSYGNVTALLVNATKELNVKVDTQQLSIVSNLQNSDYHLASLQSAITDKNATLQDDVRSLYNKVLTLEDANDKSEFLDKLRDDVDLAIATQNALSSLVNTQNATIVAINENILFSKDMDDQMIVSISGITVVDALVANSVETKTITINNDGGDDDDVEDASSIGTATIIAGQENVIIKTTAVDASDKVFVSPISSTKYEVDYTTKDGELMTLQSNVTPYISNVKDGEEFEISIDHVLKEKFDVNWWIIKNK